ncbi:glycosyltransferase [Aggregatilineales bacterium SYSU G02658]
MRVLMLSKACIVGIYQRKLEQIAAQGVTLRVLVPPSWRDERGEQPLERAYTQGYELRATPIRFNGNFHLHFYPALGRELADFQPQIVHIDEEPYNVAAWQALWLARQAGARSLFFSWQNIYRRYPPPFAWGEAWVLRRVDHALVGTDSAGAVWRAKGYAGPMTTIPQFGTDTDWFTPAPRPPRPFTVGYVGRLVEEKGLRLLLEAFAALPSDARLRIVGGGPLRAALAAQAEALKVAERVTFVPQRPSQAILDEYRQIDVLALPSLTRPNWKEQFGRVLVEAMACGLPVVGSDSGAIPGVIGDAGLIVPEGDAAALAGALRRLHDDSTLYATLAERGRARAVEHFTHAQVAMQTVAVYRQMLNDEAPPLNPPSK